MKYTDIKVAFPQFVLEAHGGLGIDAKRLGRELGRGRQERE